PAGGLPVASPPTTGQDNTVRLWAGAPGRERATLTGHASAVRAVAIAPDGTWLATTSQDNTVRLWDTAIGRPVPAPADHRGNMVCVAIAADGRHLARNRRPGRNGAAVGRRDRPRPGEADEPH